ncbi:type II secretion system protein N [Polynucleobacter sp. 71A-WALBACH]|uniref:type II secretion system protein N n=1 Tax=Polynucleobacter sp. 71A-WALBACH TaxID=2689097 RepID=UPI001C0A9C4F|nr:type II secretion system protein N [Polynucleobacter sp. 71A-WALBACH]MBU3593318.1 type II secretion system protein N [Polynucleobacter sp. 71A-WALBACH]
MKLRLDLTRQHLPKWLWVVLVLACGWVIVRQMPVAWVGGALASQTACRVMLEQPIGTIWQGSAALAFSEPNATEGGCREAMSVTERFHWETSCKPFSLSCQSEIQFAALDQPQSIQWRLGKTLIAANEIKLPANVLEGLGNPWSTLRPRGGLGARWTDLSIDTVGGSEGAGAGSSGVIRIIISNLTSPISPVKPLGSYEIAGNIAPEGLNWVLSTTSGPLLLKGQGGVASKAGMYFSGEASASPEAQESLIGLLSLLGKKEGDVYRLKF